MQFLVDPPALGGCVALVGLLGWVLGRLQAADLAPAVRHCGSPGDHVAVAASAPLAAVQQGERSGPVHAPPVQAPEGSRSALLTALAATDQLSELHEEVSAFRRRERVFATLAPDQFKGPLADAATLRTAAWAEIEPSICDRPGCCVSENGAGHAGAPGETAEPVLWISHSALRQGGRRP